ncbi:diaminopimelate epimerase [Corticibacter populi]|uniref:Diaminopimelate epimerase n=1 Tax=Corticibacter populi TaxID=1550736 RepID=A0A3M6QYI2_9BURK|nr:diaminopimelate epimerase [Corticibacter populi]RMX07943.1 diaminopimelate epimerase [Corticibacter populi]RZS35183.1 diaminopimelate epimerase [Corticibacter populi]
MQIDFTKMQGAGNDFVVLDETRQGLGLTEAHYRMLADRHFGVGADQILTVRSVPVAQQGQADFEYIIHNADGGEVEQCGNGARCFARYVFDKGLSTQPCIRVLTKAGIIEPALQPDGRVTVKMGRPRWQPEQIPFDPAGLASEQVGGLTRWLLPPGGEEGDGRGAAFEPVWIGVVSMGNPHAVQLVASAEAAPVAQTGPLIERNHHFPQRVNAGYMEVVDRHTIRLRVYERGAGETLACGTGACAAVVCGIRQGLLDARVDVHTHGGLLTIEWAGGDMDEVLMTGPAVTVFEGRINLPDLP